LDVRMVLTPNGGAVATWGSSGLGLIIGHEALQKGFHEALWNAPRGTATLGSLALGGYRQLFTGNLNCCQDSLRTFLLLGDPLMPARVFPVPTVYLPLVRR
ncbi:MAG: C25 family cysteine peptidase, partial [Chloroflexaceae bacterium]|nr:C25 family cysteine peptidase [Chloroflexaceae bacterium]